MGHPCRRPVVAGVYCVIALLATSFPALAVQPSQSIIRHDLFVEIDPQRHGLRATDCLTLDIVDASALQFTLAGTLELDRLVLSPSQADESHHDLPFVVDRDGASGPGQRITVSEAALRPGKTTVKAYYHGTINDPPREPRHLRFVTPSETAGHIGSEGVYLSSETQWYLDVPDSISEYHLSVAVPAGWTAVTQRKSRNSSACPRDICSEAGFVLTDWDDIRSAEALTLVANRFVTKTREWVSKGGERVQLGAYLFPDDAQLADEYLDATARYLEMYISLLGPYPFDQFAVVENFFASGLGMPSFTLLGSGVIRRHYVQPYALGHEIVHSWIGNAVFNRTEDGNWVEGLTTYLANYYWHEWSGDRDQARDQRRLMVRGYNLHVPAERDYPLRRFMQKHDERDNAIGYQKAAMVFHLLRQEVGEEPFWRSLKELVAHYRGRRADWRDVQGVFSQTSGKDLRWFFSQWVERPGAPRVAVKHLTARPLPDGTFQVQGQVVQAGEIFTLPMPLRISSSGTSEIIQVSLTSAENPFSTVLPSRPLSLEIDPDATVLRRIAREDLPPVLNHYVTDPDRSVVAAYGLSEGHHPFQDVVARITAQDSQKPPGERTAIIPLADDLLFPPNGSVLVLGAPSARGTLEPIVTEHCGRRLELREGGVTIDGTAYEGAGIAALVSCHRRHHPDSVVTWLYAVSPQAATTVARLLFFYGWNTVVVFQDGKPIVRGEWEPSHTRMEIPVNETVSTP